MDLRWICFFFGIIVAVNCAPVLNGEDPKDKRGSQTTKEAFELEQTLKRLAGEDKKFFPQPGSRPVPQVDGLEEQNEAQPLTKDDPTLTELSSEDKSVETTNDVVEKESPMTDTRNTGDDSNVQEEDEQEISEDDTEGDINETESEELAEEGNDVEDAPETSQEDNAEDEDQFDEDQNEINNDKGNDDDINDSRNGFINYGDYPTYDNYNPYRFQVPARRAGETYGYGAPYGGAFGELSEDERGDGEEYLLQDIMEIVRDHPKLLSQISRAQEEVDEEEPVTDEENDAEETNDENDLANVVSRSDNHIESEKDKSLLNQEFSEEEYLERLESEQDYNDRMNEIRAEILREAEMEKGLYAGGRVPTNEYYQDFLGDSTAHVVAKKMGYERRDEAINDELIEGNPLMTDNKEIHKRSGMAARNFMK